MTFKQLIEGCPQLIASVCKKTKTLPFILFGVVLSLSACTSEPGLQEYVFSGGVMGTTYRVKVLVDVPLSESEQAHLSKEIAGELNLVDQLMSTYKSDSEISRFNQLPVEGSIAISPQTRAVLNEAIDLHAFSSGALDITVQPLVRLWGFGADPMTHRAPSEDAITAALAKLGVDSLAFEGDSMLLKKAEVEVDLSSLAKGYAVDQVALYLKSRPFRNYMVEVGGEIRVAGVNQSKTAWRLGIELPDSLAQQALRVVSISNGALATSGDYRNYFESDGKRYSHTLDPRTGFPVDHKLASVSVLAQNCMRADALATALMVMGENKGYQFAQDNQLDAMFVFRSEAGFSVKYAGKFENYLN